MLQTDQNPEPATEVATRERAEKISISVQRTLLRRIDARANHLGINRSQLFSIAASMFVDGEMGEPHHSDIEAALLSRIDAHAENLGIGRRDLLAMAANMFIDGLLTRQDDDRGTRTD